MNFFGNLVHRMQNAVDAHPYLGHVPLGFNMNITCPLIKGVSEQMIHGINDMAVIGGQFIVSDHADKLLQITEINRRGIKLNRRRRNGLFETEKFIYGPDNIRLGTDHRYDFSVGRAGDIAEYFLVERIGCGDNEAVIFNINGYSQVVHGKRSGDGVGHQFHIQLDGVDFFKSNAPLFSQKLENQFFVNLADVLVFSG